jgi:hypothetical protein
MQIVTQIRAIYGLRRFSVAWVTVIVIPQAAQAA